MARQFLFFLVASLVLAGTAGAAVQKGDTELEFLGGWLSESGGTGGVDLSAYFASGGVNYFLTDTLSLGVNALGAQMQLDGTSSQIELDLEGVPLKAFFTNVDRDITLYGLGANARLHFKPTAKWVPYIGAQVKWVSAKVDTTGTYVAEELPGGPLGDEQSFTETTDMNGLLWGPLGGVRVELNEYNDFFIEGQYHLWTGDIGDLVDNGFGIFLGIVHQFR